MASSATDASKKKKRISDYLRDGDGAADLRLQEGAATTSPPSQGTPPRLRVPSFTCARIGFVRLGRIKGRGGARKELAAEKTDAVLTTVDFSGREAESGTGASSSSSMTTTEVAAGLGLSLLFLLARTSVELNKMAEVRAEMEAFLREMRNKNNNAARCKSGAAHRRDHWPTASSSTASGYSMDTAGAGGAAFSPAMDMETASGESEKPLEQEECEWSGSDEEFIELEGRFVAGSGLRRGLDDDGRGGDGDGMVSGVELERRLHELQHERDRERVAELEAALRRAERRLVEKEMEARAWKDTAELAGRR